MTTPTPTTTIGSLFTGTGALDDAITHLIPNSSHIWACDTTPTDPQYGPNLGPIQRIDWGQTTPPDILVAGFPCQDISSAGQRRGIRRGTRSGLWFEVVDAIRALRPRLVVLENVERLAQRNGGLGTVLTSLADLGFDAEWTCVRASAIGAPHRRGRWFALAWPSDAHAAVPRPSVSAVTTLQHLGIHTFDDFYGRLDPKWREYAAAVARWEHLTGESAPFPPVDDKRLLKESFAHWIMGIQAHKTRLLASREEKIGALGNAVVTRQAIWAYAILFDRLTSLPHGLDPPECQTSTSWMP